MKGYWITFLLAWTCSYVYKNSLGMKQRNWCVRFKRIQTAWCFFSAAILCHVILSFTIWIGHTWQVKWHQVEVDRNKYGRVMAIYPIACKEMATRRKTFTFRRLLLELVMDGCFRLLHHLNGNVMVSNNIWTVFLWA